MKYDVILAGVGGQGVLSVASIIAKAAISEGLEVRQSEIHGMAQRGGAVSSHLRISDKKIPGDLVPKGSADLVLSMEPLESLRYVSWLKKSGMLVTSCDPYINIHKYPGIEIIKLIIKQLPNYRLIDALEIAKSAGLAKAVNTVMVGAASGFIPIKSVSLEKTITSVFSKKDPEGINLKAYQAGQKAALAAKDEANPSSSPSKPLSKTK